MSKYNMSHKRPWFLQWRNQVTAEGIDMPKPYILGDYVEAQHRAVLNECLQECSRTEDAVNLYLERTRIPHSVPQQPTWLSDAYPECVKKARESDDFIGTLARCFMDQVSFIQ